MRLALEVFINDQPTGLIGDIYRLPDGRLMARREELIALGIVPPGKGPAREMVAFDAIPGISVFYQEREQKLQLQLPDSRRIPREYDLHAGRLRKEILPETAREFGLVTNYNAYGTLARGYGTGARPYSTGTLTLESRAISPYGTLQNSAILGTTLGREGALRLETAYVYTHRETATRVVAGDTISAGPAWSRPVRFGGVQIGRDFGLRPDIVTAPMPSVSGSAAVPSTVDVYVDTMRIASQPVGAGPFRLTNLPVSGESGTARVVVRDVTGRETATSLPFFTSARLLAPGMSDYSVEFGYPRLRYALDSFDYGERPMGQGSFRYGLSDRMTLEAHAETTAASCSPAEASPSAPVGWAPFQSPAPRADMPARSAPLATRAGRRTGDHYFSARAHSAASAPIRISPGPPRRWRFAACRFPSPLPVSMRRSVRRGFRARSTGPRLAPVSKRLTPLPPSTSSMSSVAAATRRGSPRCRGRRPSPGNTMPM